MVQNFVFFADSFGAAKSKKTTNFLMGRNSNIIHAAVCNVKLINQLIGVSRT
jgi:hypothetical protein